jgi:hypothetical protein
MNARSMKAGSVGCKSLPALGRMSGSDDVKQLDSYKANNVRAGGLRKHIVDKVPTMSDSPDGEWMGDDIRPTDLPLVASAPSILDPETSLADG